MTERIVHGAPVLRVLSEKCRTRQATRRAQKPRAQSSGHLRVAFVGGTASSRGYNPLPARRYKSIGAFVSLQTTSKRSCSFTEYTNVDGNIGQRCGGFGAFNRSMGLARYWGAVTG